MTQDPGTSTGIAPTIILIPASFTPASFYANVVDQLRETGFEVIIHTLPSASRKPPQNAATLAEDAKFFGDIAEQVADQGKDFAFVMHSYGGIVGSEASRGLTKKERRAVGKQGGLIRLVYLTAVVPPLANSLNDMLGNPDNLAMEGQYMKNEPAEECAKTQYPDLPLDEGIKWVNRMTLHSAQSFADKLTYPGYRYTPVSWITCDNDLILTYEFQHRTIGRIEQESGNKVDVYSLKAGHFPSVSIPMECANAISTAVRAQ